jgi:kynurenine 3-monooxygenase
MHKIENKNACIIGAGLVGSLWAVYLSKAGYQVTVFERRQDMRKQKMSAGKSINLALSYRGWNALEKVGISAQIKEIAIPMYGRTMHHKDCTSTYQPYGNDNQAIYSVSRGELNAKLMDIAEENLQTNIYFDQECTKVDTVKGIAYFRNVQTGEETEFHSNLIFAADGAFSAARYSSMQKLDRFDFSQKYIADGYREILLPANEDGSPKLATETLHIWPRERFMLIALPNFDGSFTCTLFMPFENHTHCFSKLTSKEKVETFFKEVFPDFFEMMPHIAEAWEQHPLASLAIIRCFPWTHGKLALMGDAAHATVPFFGQGMNAGFEDCSTLWDLMQEPNGSIEEVFSKYQELRKPNTDAMQELSLQNYIVMRDKVADPDFLLLQRVERRINKLFPDKYFPLYSMVSFTNIPYHTALEKGNEQEQRVKEWIEKYRITQSHNDQEIDTILGSIEELNSL